MDTAQIISTIGLLAATTVLVGIEYVRWRPVLVLNVRYIQCFDGWHAVLEIMNIGGSAASGVEFEFEDLSTAFVNHPTAAAEMSENLRYDTLIPNRARYLYLSNVHVRHTQDEELRERLGEGSINRSETHLGTLKGRVSYKRYFRRRRMISFELEPDPRWWLGELPDFSTNSLDSILELDDKARRHNLFAEVMHAHPELDEEDEGNPSDS